MVLQAADASANIGRSQFASIFGEAQLTAPLSPEAVQSIDRIVQERLSIASALDLTVANQSGTIVYSTNAALIGSAAPRFMVDALAGSQRQAISLDATSEATAKAQKLLTVYVPFAAGTAETSIQAAFSFSQDYTNTDHRITQLRHVIRAGVFGGFAVISIVLLLILRRGTTLIRTQEHDIRSKSEELLHLAYHDALTGLPNRALFKRRLDAALAAKSAGAARSLAVLFVDLDRFKLVNDTLGHATGDELLKSVAEHLTQFTRKEDTVARVGGDEFTILIEEMEADDEASTVATRILGDIKTVRLVNGYSLRVAASIGIAVFPDDGTTAEELLANADAAMYVAKEQGRDNAQTYLPGQRSNVADRLTLENELRQALERNEFFLSYQPIFDSHGLRLVGVEALVRWDHPEMGVVSPGTFIPVAEETGLIIPIGERVLMTACQQLKEWHEDDLPGLRLAVNLSPRQFLQRDLCSMVARVLNETGFDARYLDLEITESSAMKDAEWSRVVLAELAQMGIRIALDDFGTGYSSLSQLRDLPIHALKIDQSFVRDMIEYPESAAITEAIVALARTLHLDVIAEGVETAAQLEALTALGDVEVQGFLFARPLPAVLAHHRLARVFAESTNATRLHAVQEASSY